MPDTSIVDQGIVYIKSDVYLWLRCGGVKIEYKVDCNNPINESQQIMTVNYI